MNNPIFNRIKDNLTTNSKKDTGFINLCLSLVSIVIFILISVIFKYLDNEEVVVNVACISFIVLVLETILFSYKSFKTIALYLIYAVLLGLSLASISYATFNVLKSFFESPLIVFVITGSILLINLVESILYYIKGFLVNHFFYKLIFASLITLVIIGVIMIIILKAFSSVYFIYLIASLIINLLYGFTLTMYFEEIRKIKNEIDDKYAYDLSILTSTLPLYFLVELFYYLFKKGRKESE